MIEVARFLVHGRTPVLVEIDSPYVDGGESNVGIGPAGRRREKDRGLSMSFEEHLAGVRAAAAAALDAFRESVGPDEIKLTFGVKLTAESGAVIAKTAFEGNLGVELAWKRDAPGSERQP